MDESLRAVFHPAKPCFERNRSRFGGAGTTRSGGRDRFIRAEQLAFFGAHPASFEANGRYASSRLGGTSKLAGFGCQIELPGMLLNRYLFNRLAGTHGAAWSRSW